MGPSYVGVLAAAPVDVAGEAIELVRDRRVSFLLRADEVIQ
jgi:hypothetical protein